MGTTESTLVGTSPSPTSNNVTSSNIVRSGGPSNKNERKRHFHANNVPTSRSQNAADTNDFVNGGLKGLNDVQLRGSILGGSGTGKTALFQRLRGEDPFEQRIQKKDSNDPQQSQNKPPQTSDTIAWTDNDERTSAYVNLSDGIYTHPLDFAIILIDPLRKETLEEAFRIALQLLDGKATRPIKQPYDKNDNDKDKPLIKRQSCSCICFMLNFKDISSQMPEQCISFQTVQKFAMQLSSKESTKPNIPSSNKSYIYCLESSMKNCYGLLPLHNFIQIPYLLRRETILQSLLQKLTADRINANTHLQMTLKNQDYSKFLNILSSTNPSPGPHPSHSPPVVATIPAKTRPIIPQENKGEDQPKVKRHDETRTAISNGTSIPPSTATTTTTTPQRNTLRAPTPMKKSPKLKEERSNINTSSKSAVIVDKNSNDNTSAKSQNKHDISNGPASMDHPRNIQPTSSTQRTKIFPKIKEDKNIRTRMYDPNQTLEDFFADDDDGDIDQNVSNKSNNSYSDGRHHKIHHNVSDDDEDEDDEDDFYYDLTGSKIVAHDSSNRKKSGKTNLPGPKKENNMSTPTLSSRKSEDRKNDNDDNKVITPSSSKSPRSGVYKNKTTNTSQDQHENMDDNDESKFSKSKNSNSNLPSYPDESKSDKHLENERNENLQSKFDASEKENPESYSDTTTKQVSQEETEVVSGNDNVKPFDRLSEKSENTSKIKSSDKENVGESLESPSINETNDNDDEKEKSSFTEDGWSDDDDIGFILEDDNDNKDEITPNDDSDILDNKPSLVDEKIDNDPHDDIAKDGWSDDESIGFILEEDNDQSCDDAHMTNSVNNSRPLAGQETNTNKAEADGPKMSAAALAAIASAKQELMASLNNDELNSQSSSIQVKSSQKKKSKGDVKKKKKKKKKSKVGEGKDDEHASDTKGEKRDKKKTSS